MQVSMQTAEELISLHHYVHIADTLILYVLTAFFKFCLEILNCVCVEASEHLWEFIYSLDYSQVKWSDVIGQLEGSYFT